MALHGSFCSVKRSCPDRRAISDATRKRLLDLGGGIPDKKGRTGAYLGEFVKAEVARWTPILKATGAVGN
jgi:hypothetical protein